MRFVCFLLLVAGLQAAAGQAPKQAPSTNADELLRGGLAAQQGGDYQTAIENYRKALAIKPGLTEARANLGVALAATGQLDAAIEQDSLVLSGIQDNAAVLNNVELAYYIRMNLARAYYTKGDFSHAHAEFAALHAAKPLDLSAAVFLGYTDLKLGKEADAAELLAPLEAGHESNMDLEYVLAYAQIHSGKDDDGVPRMERVARATHSADAYVAAGAARLCRKEYSEARADLDAALELNPSIPGAYTLAGTARAWMGDEEAAVPALQAALRADPMDFDANLYLGTIRLGQRDIEAAKPLLELALQLRPKSAPARYQMAKLNSVLGNYTAAVNTLEDLVKADPNWLDPHVDLAALYYKLHRPEDGLRERAIVQRIEAEQPKLGPPRQ
jgi:tetratricopeptide (TPR) repeat protein